MTGRSWSQGTEPAAVFRQFADCHTSDDSKKGFEKLYLDNYSRQLRLQLRREAVESIRRQTYEADCTFCPATNSSSVASALPVFDRLSIVSSSANSSRLTERTRSNEHMFCPTVNHEFDEKLNNWSRGVAVCDRLYGVHLYKQEQLRDQLHMEHLGETDRAEKDAARRRAVAIEQSGMRGASRLWSPSVERLAGDAAQREVRIAMRRRELEDERARELTFCPQVHRTYTRPSRIVHTPRETKSVALYRANCKSVGRNPDAFDAERYRHDRDAFLSTREATRSNQKSSEPAPALPVAVTQHRSMTPSTFDRLSKKRNERTEQLFEERSLAENAAHRTLFDGLLRDSHESLLKLKKAGIIIPIKPKRKEPEQEEDQSSSPQRKTVATALRCRESSLPLPSDYLGKHMNFPTRRSPRCDGGSLDLSSITLGADSYRAKPNEAAIELARRQHIQRQQQAAAAREQREIFLNASVHPSIQAVVERSRGKTKTKPFRLGGTR